MLVQCSTLSLHLLSLLDEGLCGSKIRETIATVVRMVTGF